MKSILLCMLCVIILIACAQNNSGWSQEEKRSFINACVENAQNKMGQSESERYCNCMLGVSMSRWRSGAEADKMFLKMTYEEILNFTEPCQ